MSAAATSVDTFNTSMVEVMKVVSKVPDVQVMSDLDATVAYARRQRTWFRKERAAARIETEPVVGALVTSITEAPPA